MSCGLSDDACGVWDLRIRGLRKEAEELHFLNRGYMEGALYSSCCVIPKPVSCDGKFPLLPISVSWSPSLERDQSSHPPGGHLNLYLSHFKIILFCNCEIL